MVVRSLCSNFYIPKIIIEALDRVINLLKSRTTLLALAQVCQNQVCHFIMTSG